MSCVPLIPLTSSGKREHCVALLAENLAIDNVVKFGKLNDGRAAFP